MAEAFTYQLSDLDTFVSEARYAYSELDDVEELAEEIESSLLSEQPSLCDVGLVLVIGDAEGIPVHVRPLGRIH